ncbi:13624_t:CDS:2, partial [Ambispora leptoticha]
NSESSSTAARRKATEKSVDEQHAKKIRIFMLKKGIEEECGANYKHDGGTSNMKFHLRTKHGILGPDDLIQDSNKRQLQIDKMIRKVIWDGVERIACFAHTFQLTVTQRGKATSVPVQLFDSDDHPLSEFVDYDMLTSDEFEEGATNIEDEMSSENESFEDDNSDDTNVQQSA